MFDGIGWLDTFLTKMVETIPETQIIQDMNAIFKGTPMNWWEMHCIDLHEWAQAVECIKVNFQPMNKFE
jgi:hypothetical protein